MRDCGLVNTDEPFTGLFTQGMVTHETYQDANGKWLFPSEYEALSDKSTAKVGPTIKMSKSKKNVVDPEEIMESYGADAARLFILSDSPPERDLEWTESGIEGAWRYINRLHRLITDNLNALAPIGTKAEAANSSEQNLLRLANQTIDGVGSDIDKFQMNKAVARIREFSNAIEKFIKDSGDLSNSAVLRESFETLVQMFAPMMPHLAEELWHLLGHTEIIYNQPWPKVDESLLAGETVTIGVQVNGKVRAQITLPKDADKAAFEKEALAQDNVQKAIDGKPVRKVIVVPGRIVNVVVG
jgi:leucyl-tRNA synthetase